MMTNLKRKNTLDRLKGVVRYWYWILPIILLAPLAPMLLAVDADGPNIDQPQELRKQAENLYQEGNYQESYNKFRLILFNVPSGDFQQPRDLDMAVNCLNSLNKQNEIDALLEEAVKTHARNWKMLQQAAREYLEANHGGYIIAGEFERGYHRGGGKQVYSFERDRVRALQIMEQARQIILEGEYKDASVAYFYQHYGELWQQGRLQSNESWRLQYLTDISELPDYEESYYYGGQTRGAPVDAEGNPVYYSVPESFDAAASDGERWRWCLHRAVEIKPDLKPNVQYTIAIFLYQQFGVQTMASYGYWRSQPADEADESGTYALHTLNDNETIARLATGIKRFNLPDEFNYIEMFKELNHYSASLQLANIYQNRRQYPEAAKWWKRVMEIMENNKDGHQYQQAQKALAQIEDNWGRFEPVMNQPAGKGASVDFRYRNGNHVTFEAYAVDVPKLLNDVKKYIRKKPRRLDWDQVNIGDIGRRIVWDNQDKYIGEKVAEWQMDLEPRPQHFDKQITVTTPLQKAGAYLLVSKMRDGNTSRVIIWLDDTAILKKPMSNKMMYYVADARTGEPIPDANLEFFGYWNEYKQRNNYEIHIKQFAENANDKGMVFTTEDQQPRNYQWMIVATTKEGRFGYMGFVGVWFPNYYDHEYNQEKAFLITDRPVYRPNQKVQYKFWVRHARYDKEDVSTFAGRQFTVELYNPKNDVIETKQFTADEYGGFSGEYEIPDGAPLGNYRFYISGKGGGNFRVEEYKKPEFEVKVDAPDKPVMLGEKIEVKLQADYYFGEPVREAKVKYKVLRHEHNARWYPSTRWDWFYGAGYWWFGYDYTWYPGWRRWGCWSPAPWWHHRASPQPELVMENEVPIGPDGKIEIEIDTAMAKEMHGDTDHRYEITAEVTDMSRRTIVGTGSVLVAREPFKVYTWLERGHYRVGDDIRASFQARTIAGKQVAGQAEVALYRVSYPDAKPEETLVQEWEMAMKAEGENEMQIAASSPGQYRLSCTVTDAEGHVQEGAYVFTIAGQGFDGREYRFNDIELIPDKKNYAPGEKVNLQINTNHPGSTVLYFMRPANGVYLEPSLLRLDGKSAFQEIEISKKDMPNIFVEAVTISDGKIHMAAREITVPPESRVMDLKIEASAPEYKPGEKARINLRLTGPDGKPFVGSLALTVYDKAVEYISGGSNVPDIKEFFWKWRRSHNPQNISNLERYFYQLLKQNEIGMGNLGVFGASVAQELGEDLAGGWGGGEANRGRKLRSELSMAMSGAVAEDEVMPSAAPMQKEAKTELADRFDMDKSIVADDEGAALAASPGMVAPTVRKNFADTAFWTAAITTDDQGQATVEFDMPENLTGWKIKSWAMTHGARVAEAEETVVTKKNLMIRMQAPRFFIEKDEVVLSANVHNYLDSARKVEVYLELEGPELEPVTSYKKFRFSKAGEEPEVWGAKIGKTITVEAGGEQRVDWRVKAIQEGAAIIRMSALTDEESDAMQMDFPVHVHGMDKMESFSGFIKPEGDSATITLDVPAERRIDESRLEVRYSPTLAGAMVDALPYLVDYPYGCTEQTLSRFLPTLITQKILLDMGLDLEDIREKKSNLNAQEIGDDKERATQWKRYRYPNGEFKNPVFDETEVERMVKEGVEALTEMQLSDGGWGWFSGYGERSWPHTTAYVVHGLQVAEKNDIGIVPSTMERGVNWLKNYQAAELQKLINWEESKDKTKKIRPYKQHADNLDAFVYMVLADAGFEEEQMREFIYRDRNELAVYAKAMFGIGLQSHIDAKNADRPEPYAAKRDMIIRNIEQFLQRDEENQTAYLNLQNNGYWWYWYGSEYEAHAYYLKLLAATKQCDDWRAPYLVKYLLNNRKHATYWNSTRDTAICIEAFADYLKATNEHKPDLTVEIFVDGKRMQETRITAENLFTYDNSFVLEGDAVETGEHKIEIRKTGTGPLYFNAYLSYFTLEDFIDKAGLEVKVERRFYKLVEKDKSIKVAGAHGQALDQKVEAYERVPIENESMLESGQLVEIELIIESKNDYEYLVFEDMKAAGFEPVEVRSGYNGNEMGAYVEFRDNRVAFFVKNLARGKHSVSYRLRAEIPGRFSALPAHGYAMYAPELRGNSDELKIRIKDAE